MVFEVDESRQQRVRAEQGKETIQMAGTGNTGSGGGGSGCAVAIIVVFVVVILLGGSMCSSCGNHSAWDNATSKERETALYLGRHGYFD